MKHEQLVFEALSYYRYRGIDANTLRGFLGVHEDRKHTITDDRRALDRFEREGLLYRVGRKWFLTGPGLARARGRAYEPEWQPEDSWVLLALLYADDSRPCPLVDLISIADYMNHSVLTREEAHGAINRLVAGKLISVRAGAFVPSAAARAMMKKIEATCGKYVHGHLQGLARMLVCPCCGVKLKRVTWRYRIDEADMKRAVADYLRRMKG